MTDETEPGGREPAATPESGDIHDDPSRPGSHAKATTPTPAEFVPLDDPASSTPAPFAVSSSAPEPFPPPSKRPPVGFAAAMGDDAVPGGDTPLGGDVPLGGEGAPVSLNTFESLPAIDDEAIILPLAAAPSSSVEHSLPPDSGLLSSDSGSSFLGATALQTDHASQAATPAATTPESLPDLGPVRRSRTSSLTTLLFTWASVATILALWLWWTRPEYPSGLENLPDDGKLNVGIVSPTVPLSTRLTIELGQTKRVGDLEVTPLGVEFRSVKIVAPDGKLLYEPNTLALRLRLKNVSAANTFHPTDPLFCSLVQRGRSPRQKRAVTDKVTGRVIFEDGYTYTFAHPRNSVGDFAGFILPYDLHAVRDDARIEEQTFPRLKPGASADELIVAHEGALDQVAGPMLWRVKLRKGKLASGQGIATVIGVPFVKADIVMKAKVTDAGLLQG